MEAIKTIVEDDRPITAIHWDDEDGSVLSVGDFGVTKIVAYGEPAEYCLVPWIAVYKGEEIAQRIPAKVIRIVYEK